MLLVHLLLFILYGLTLSVMFFVYSLIAILIQLIITINFQPLKKVGLRYPLYDLIFLILLCFSHIVILERGLINIERYSDYHKAFVIIVILTAIIPILYIFFSHWLMAVLKDQCMHTTTAFLLAIHLYS